ncbi:unnamed protein product [Caenorhabditis angaria]|uniref:FHA domain-containing protein n=1 Tax=Caenorhabditis angaria TaxID=860376 RepID=A0A9P1N280_9PELO|nr:unnamed protein product [Caenorhabditis angaria]
MLRRYNSTNLDTFVLKNKKTTIGSSPNCDIIVKGRGISEFHASIESNSTGFWLKEHSLSGITRVNDLQVVGQIELQSGDLIQIGPINNPFVFENQWMIGTRPNSSKPNENNNMNILPSITAKRITPISKRKRSVENSLRSSASSTESSVPRANSRESIRQLSISQIPSATFYQTSVPPIQTPSSFSYSNQYFPLRPRLESIKSSTIQPIQPNFELCAYRGFLSAISAQLRSFNDRVLKNPQREYAEVFTAMCRACDVPLQTRIMEIEKHCEIVLIDSDFEENEELITKLDHFIRESRREKILELTQELENIIPVVRDAASNARENIKVCNVFTQWSRQFGDIIRTSTGLTSEILFQAIDDLKRQFSEAHMSRHWLPPSITPILRLAALELEKSKNFHIQETPTDTQSNIAQIESIQHEMSFHIKNLETRIDKSDASKLLNLVENLGSDYRKMMEMAGISPKNSIMSFEVTPEDISNGRENLEEQTAGPIQKIIDYSEEVEIMNQKICGILGGPSEKQFEESKKKVQISEKLLKELLENSERLLMNENSKNISTEEKSEETGSRQKRSPMILVNEASEVQSEVGEEDLKIIEEVESTVEDSEVPESVTSPIPQESPEIQLDIPEPSDVPDSPEIRPESPEPRTNRSEVEPEQEPILKQKIVMVEKSASETHDPVNVVPEVPEPQSSDPEVSDDQNLNKLENGNSSETPSDIRDNPESGTPEVVEPDTNPENPEVPETPLIFDSPDVPLEIVEEFEQHEKLEESSENRVLRNLKGYESHWKSHQNTANGKPNIVYQYPTTLYRNHTSPSSTQKRRSKSEEQRIKSSLANRPPFVLY